MKTRWMDVEESQERPRETAGVRYGADSSGTSQDGPRRCETLADGSGENPVTRWTLLCME